ncbi:MAG: DUF2779 domain-containing protein [Deltaproteobacteria bacterium]|jgi:hypothetical protein|nr:DUF2779 domain-containing protein [Deltaproteobacteria bacterium]
MHSPKSFFLSKSQFTRGLQCHKSLWLLKNRRELQEKPDAALQARFDAGSKVGILAQKLFPNGVGLEYESGLSENIQKTRELISSGTETIYEATFRHDNVLAMVDILTKGENGWDMYEVKSSTDTKDIFINDTAIQYYVVKGSGLDVAKVFLVHLNKRYIRIGELDLQALFTVDDVTGQTEGRQHNIPHQLAEMRRSLEGSEPVIDIGQYCNDPYECDFKQYCWQHIPEHSIFDIAKLRTNRKFSLYYSGILKLQDIPADFSLSDSMQIQVEAELTGREFINKRKIREFLTHISDPVGFLDFETFMEPVPSFDCQRPYQQIPFQYSLHISENGNITHCEFLGEPGIDPRPVFIEKLLEDTGTCRTILVYNQNFEVTRLREIAADFPEFTEGIESIITRIIDLMIPFRNKDYYVKEMSGSHSIKYVLPALVPELSYEGLNIADGEMAMLAYANLYQIESAEEKNSIRRDLLAYCRLDTLGMVKIWEKLVSLTRPKGQLSLF